VCWGLGGKPDASFQFPCKTHAALIFVEFEPFPHALRLHKKVSLFLNKMKSIKTIIKYIILIMMTMSPSLAVAEMRSDSYVINENVNHSFDGPIISGVSHSVSGLEVTVNFTTNVAANAFVVYDTDSGFSSSMEQGTSVIGSTVHSIAIKGLAENTRYYYRIRSKRVNGGETVDVTLRSFVTGSSVSSSTDSTKSGGGVLIIDKTDKNAPVISNVQLNIDGELGVVITWETDENATSFIEYGETIQYGNVNGQWDNAKNHSVIIRNLLPGLVYHFRPVSSDGWGNIGYGEDKILVHLGKTTVKN